MKTNVSEATPFVHTNMSDEDKGKCCHDMMVYGQCYYRTDENGVSRHVPLSEVLVDWKE